MSNIRIPAAVLAAAIATCMVPSVLAADPSAPRLADPQGPPAPRCISDYDSGEVYWVRQGRRQPFHGMRAAWRFNRGLTWLHSPQHDLSGVLCYSGQTGLQLSGDAGVSEWFTDGANELKHVGANVTRFVHKSAWPADHAHLPALQFHLGQHPQLELEVKECNQPWQLLVAMKGRSGPPLYASPWYDRTGTIRVPLADLLKGRLYGPFCELHFFLCTWRREAAAQPCLQFNLRLPSQPAIVTGLPAFVTAERGQDTTASPLLLAGLQAVVTDETGLRLRKNDAQVWAHASDKEVALDCDQQGIWRLPVPRLALKAGEQAIPLRAEIRARPELTLRAVQRVIVSQENFVRYDPQTRLLARHLPRTQQLAPLGPLTGSYRGQVLFQDIGTPQEKPLHGQHEWLPRRHAPEGTLYGAHWWESLSPAELDADYAYLARCGWTLVHLCQGWLWWERLDAGGRLAPYGAQQLASVLAAAERHGLRVHFALSHYPLGKASQPYAQYLDAGYRREDYDNRGSPFYAMFENYLRQFITVFGDAPALSSFTAAGEGDIDCGTTFVNFVREKVYALDRNHIMLCEPHGAITRRPDAFTQQGWDCRAGGFRTYSLDKKPIEEIAVQFRLAGMAHVFMAEGLFWGYMNGARHTDAYRRRVRETIYTGLALRTPILLTWEERVVEDERVVFEQVRRAVDWARPVQAPAIRVVVGPDSLAGPGYGALCRLEASLQALGVTAGYCWEDEQLPPDSPVVLSGAALAGPPPWVAGEAALPAEAQAQRMLELPPGLRAVCSRTDDGTTLLAFIRAGDSAVARPVQEGPILPVTEAGPYTYADTALALPAPMRVKTWEVHCVRPGRVQLRIYRRQDGKMNLIARGPLVQMKTPGPQRFDLDRPLELRPGDLPGLYIPDESTHVLAERGKAGGILFQDGEVKDAKTDAEAWQSEPKALRLRLIGVDGAAHPSAPAGAPPAATQPAAAPARPPATRPAMPVPEGIRVTNPTARPLRLRLFDLETKKAVVDRPFEGVLTVDAPPKAEHLFLLVTPVDPPAGQPAQAASAPAG